MLKLIVLALIQFVALVSGWDVRDANASVAARTGLPKATDGSARSVPNSAARHASDGRGIYVWMSARGKRGHRYGTASAAS